MYAVCLSVSIDKVLFPVAWSVLKCRYIGVCNEACFFPCPFFVFSICAYVVSLNVLESLGFLLPPENNCLIILCFSEVSERKVWEVKSSCIISLRKRFAVQALLYNLHFLVSLRVLSSLC